MDVSPDSAAAFELGRFTIVRHRRELLADGRPVELGGGPSARWWP